MSNEKFSVPKQLVDLLMSAGLVLFDLMEENKPKPKVSPTKEPEPQAVRLPDQFINGNVVSRMRPGEDGWILPGSMKVDTDYRCWLDPSATVFSEQGHPSRSMRILRLDSGFQIWPKNHRWMPDTVDHLRRTWIPVTKLYYAKEDAAQ
jgi:hypothetical protein